MFTSVAYSRVKNASNQLETGWLLGVKYKGKSEPSGDGARHSLTNSVGHVLRVESAEEKDSKPHVNYPTSSSYQYRSPQQEHISIKSELSLAADEDNQTERERKGDYKLSSDPLDLMQEVNDDENIIIESYLDEGTQPSSIHTKENTPPQLQRIVQQELDSGTQHLVDTNNISTSGFHEEEVPSSPPIVPCINVGKRQNIKTNNKGWIKFKQSLEEYATFHKKRLNILKAGGNDSRYITTLMYTCNDPSACSGLGDQFNKIQQALLLAIAFDRVLILHWDTLSMKTFHHIIPNQIQWRYFNESVGMHLKSEPELMKLTSKEHFKGLMQLLGNNGRTHVTLSNALPVPFGRGLSRILSADKNGVFSKISWYAMHVGQRNGIPKSVLCGELLRYLFTFSQEVLEKVEQAQKQIGIFDTPYVGVHIRTGFFGTEFQEVGKFSRFKITRADNKWQSTMNCSTRLASKLLTPNAPVYLATDSYLVKTQAAKGNGTQIRSINMMLQHVALLGESKAKKHKQSSVPDTNMNLTSEPDEIQGISTLSGVDGYMATWVDFLLLARADILVHSISGFSTIAGQFCSIPRQFYTPRCTLRPSP